MATVARHTESYVENSSTPSRYSGRTTPTCPDRSARRWAARCSPEAEGAHESVTWTEPIGPAGKEPIMSSKFGLRGFALALRHDLRDAGVGVSIVEPLQRFSESERLGADSTMRTDP